MRYSKIILKRRRPRGIKRVKGLGEVGSGSSSNPLETDGSDDEECEVNDMALGSSFITSGSDSSGEDNETKKPRLDQSMTESEGVGGQDGKCFYD